MLSKERQRRGQSDLQLLIEELSTRSRKPQIKRTPRFLFRALVRTVINNLKWLKEEETEGETKAKFTKKMKGLLRTDVSERTTEDKTLIRRLIGNMKCLLRYPVNVRENLATTAMFSYFGPGRKLVSEGHPSIAMYFIISGKVNVSKMTFDPGVREFRPVTINVMEAGDSFGEINILHDEPWPNTVTTVTDVEILKVEKEIFRRILEDFLGEQKTLITEALRNLSFFKHWNQRTILECCILARIENYHKDDLILDDSKHTRNSYFIIDGQCLVVYHLQIEILDREKNKIKITDNASENSSYYSPFLPVPEVTLSGISCQASSKISVLSKPHAKSSVSATSRHGSSRVSFHSKSKSQPIAQSSISTQQVSPKVSFSNKPRPIEKLSVPALSQKASLKVSISSKSQILGESPVPAISHHGPSKISVSKSQVPAELPISVSSHHASVHSKSQAVEKSSPSGLSRHALSKVSVHSKVQPIPEFSRSTLSSLSELIGVESAQSLINSLSTKRSSKEDEGRSEIIEVESHFIRIGVLFPGQCFGIGEDLSNKFFLSNAEPVTVLAIPRDFLNLHNRANIWQRMMAFFNRTYPSPETILDKFLSGRKWEINRKEYFESVTMKKDKPFTGLTTADVPYHFRLTEDITNPIFNRVRKTVRKVKIVTEERSER